MTRYSLDFLFVSETWARADSQAPRNADIAYWGPWTDRSSTGHTHYGVALFVGQHIKRTDVIVTEGVQGHTVWWKYRGILFGGIYLAPSHSCDQLQHSLMPSFIREDEEVVLIGDFNMRLGHLTGDQMWCRRATDLHPWLMDRGFVHIPTQFGEATNVRNRDGIVEERSIVDYVFSRLGEDRHVCTEVVVDPDLGKSDHRMIMTQVLAVQPSPEQTEVEWELNVLKLKSRKEEYQACATRCMFPLLVEWEQRLGQCRSINEAQHIVTDVEAEIRGVLTEAAQMTVGPRQKPRTGRQILRHEGFQRAKRALRAAFLLKNACPNEENVEALREARREHTRMLHEARETAFVQFTERINELADHEVSKIIAAQYRRLVRCKSHLPADPASLEKYASHFGKAWAWNREVHDPVTAPEVGCGETSERFPLEWQDVFKAMEQMPKAKTPGPSKFRNELVIFAPSTAAIALHMLFATCWRWGVVPSTWTVALIHPVPKKGDLSLIENYRPISLTETLRKLYEKCLQPILTRMIEPLDIAQGGFREKRSTLEDVVALHETIVQRKASTGKYPIVAYLDIKAAYDTVHRRRLWHILREKGTSLGMIATLKALFDCNTSRVGIMGATSRVIDQPMGLLQGSILSPILYAGFIDALAGRIRRVSDVFLGSHRLGGFFYADDIAIVADSPEALARMLAECEMHSRENGYRFNPNKCEIVAEEAIDTTGCQLYQQQLVRSGHFVYLGVTMDVRGISKEAHVMRLAAKAHGSIAIARTIGMNGKGFSTQVKKRIYETFIRPKFEYGLAIIPPSERMMEMLQRVQYRALCAMMSVSPNTGSNALHALTGVQSMRQRWRELSASFWRRTTRLGSQYMVYHARRAHENRNVRSSAFHKEVERNVMIQQYKARTFGRTLEEELSIGTMKQIKQSARFADRCEMWVDPSKKLQVELIEFQRYRTVTWVDTLLGRQARRLVYLWILHKLVGRPRPCLNCLESLASFRHVQECMGLNVDRAIKERKYVLAADMIGQISWACLGRPLGNLRSELEAAREKEPVKLLMILSRERDHHPDRGAHASWRYFYTIPLVQHMEPP